MSESGTARETRRRSVAARLRRGALALLPALATAALLLGGLEWFVRSQLDVYRCDEQLGWTFRPGGAGLKWNRHREFAQRVAFNRGGFRDVERSPEAPEGTYRILALGDSFTASLQVPRERTFLARAEDALAEELRAGRRLEVINAGVDGFGTAQQLLLFRERGARYAPDLVLLQFFVENDLTDNFRAAGDFNHYLAARCGRPYFELRDGKLRFTGRSASQQAESALERALRRSQLYTTLRPVPSTNGSAPAFTNFDLLVREPPAAVAASWRLTESLLLALRDEVHASGARFGVIALPQKQAVGQLTEDERRRFRMETLRRGHAQLLDFLRRHDIPAVDLLPDLARAVQRGDDPYFTVDSHLDAGGHAVAGEALAEWLASRCESLGIPLRSCGGDGARSS